MSSWIGPAIVATIISSIVTALGWLVAYRRDIRLDASRRRERVIDVQTALRAEIRSNHSRLSSFDLDEYASSIIDRMNEEDKRGGEFTPFVPQEVNSFIFEAIADGIQVLPTQVIDPVVLYYRQIYSITQFVDDLRSDVFRQLETDRKIGMYRDYIAMNVYALALAEQAIDALDASLTEPDSLNIPASDPSDRKSALDSSARGAA